MATKSRAAPTKNSRASKAKGASTKNNLGGFGPNSLGFPTNQGTPFGVPLSESNPLFVNLRWYLISNFRQLLNELYAELGLVQTVVNVPVDDGLRGGIEIASKQLDEDQIQEVQAKMERMGDIRAVGQTAKWNRLFGGAATIVITDQDPETELDLEALTPDSELEFHAVDLWELFWDQQNLEGFDLKVADEKFEFYSYYDVKLHKSRAFRMVGIIPPSFIRPRMRGWGLSVCEALVRGLNQYLKSTNLAYEVLDEFKIDVYKFKGLANLLLLNGGQATVKQRVAEMNYMKNFQNALVLDEDDEFDHKQLSFTGIAETMKEIRMQIASELRMPITKIFGISAAGFNSGEDDIEVYNAMVESEVREKIKFDLLKVVELRCQQLFGFIPDDLKITFQPLRVMSSEQQENVKTQKFNRLLAARTANEITTFEFREAVNKGNLLDVTLDLNGDALNPDDPQIEDLNAGVNEEEDEAGDEGETSPGSGGSKKTTAKEAKQANSSKHTKMKRHANSPKFDQKSYEADGGDIMMDSRRKSLFDNPLDQSLYISCAEESCEIYGGTGNWKFTIWLYEKRGGKF